jgi:hypothetical protein
MPLDIIKELDPKKTSFRPSKWPRKLKLLKIVNCQNCQKTVLSQLEKVGGHRYPSGSLPLFACLLYLHCLPFCLWGLHPTCCCIYPFVTTLRCAPLFGILLTICPGHCCCPHWYFHHCTASQCLGVCCNLSSVIN